MTRYQLRFKFFETEAEAISFCDSDNSTGTYYKRKHKRAIYTPWRSTSPTDKARFIAWYYM